MAKSQQTWNKKEKEKKRLKKKEDKALKKEDRKSTSSSSDLNSMIAYVDEFGNITDTPPDPTKKKKLIDVESIQLGAAKREDTANEDPTKRGTVTFFDASKGYGFIKQKDSQDSYFTHINRHIDEIKEGNTVTFTLEMGQKGPVAVDVKIDK
ncbi:MAG: cold shock domain-containing protein [Bacteroidetes bacterium]|nr:cold shock domain-containing protein [Bacteroidota bacterium]